MYFWPVSQRLYVHVCAPCCLSRLFISPVCQLRSWGEMRSEVSKNRRYGLGRPPLGDNEEDWAVYTLCVYVCKRWGGNKLECAEESNKKKWWRGQSHTFCVRRPLSMIIHCLSVSKSWCSRCMFLVTPLCLCMREGGRERENFLTRWHFAASLCVSQTSSIHWVIPHSDLCLLSSPLITFTFCDCQCSDRQPTKVPPVNHPSYLYIILTASKETLATFQYF